MDRRTKILGGVFLAIVCYALIANVAYPSWIKPLLETGERVAEQQEELDKLEAGEAEVQMAKLEYGELLDRMSSFDAAKAENDLRERLNQLVGKHGLEEVTTSGGGRVSRYKKTDFETMNLSLSATGTLRGVIGFLKDLSELPHVLRLGNVAMFPSRSSRKGRAGTQIQLRVPLEVAVLPQQRILGNLLKDEDLKQPESYVRHEGRNYSEIWERTPFTEFVPPEPLVANAGRTINVELNTPTSMQGSATGGDGNYTYLWSPEEGLSDPNTARPKLDTSTTWKRDYTLTVTDGLEEKSTSTVTVTIREKAPAVTETRPTEPPKPVGPQRWAENNRMKLLMALMHREGDVRLDEVMVFHLKSKETTYHELGAEFDGGELVFVHPRGAISRRKDDYFIYPLGCTLNQDIRMEEAGDYPVLQAAAYRLSGIVLETTPETGAVLGQPASTPSGGGPEEEETPVVEEQGSATTETPSAPGPKVAPAAAPASRDPNEDRTERVADKPKKKKKSSRRRGGRKKGR